MPATDSELTSMEDPPVEDEKGGLTDVPPSATPAAIIASPPFPATMTNFTGETEIENRAVSMASHDCSSALSSPAEASPAKPAVTSSNTHEGTVETSPPTSNIASASDSLKCSGTNLDNIPDSLPLSKWPSSTFGGAEQKHEFPAVLTFKGVTVSLDNNSVWKQFNSCGTEMILTKQGRRMFPYCRYRLAGLDPEGHYTLVLSLVPSDQYKYRWNRSQWESNAAAENQTQGLIRAFAHHYATSKGSVWMGGLVSFYKLKLTNNFQDQDGHIILHSMHRYIPRLHVIPVPDGVTTTPDKPVFMGPESMTFTFPQTEFMAVTTYQNFRITQLKINHNPFAKGFREDGHNPRLVRVSAEAPSMVKIEAQFNVLEPNESKEEAVDLSTKNRVVPASVSNGPTRLVLKPIMSTSSNKNQFVHCLRGKHALGELVLVEKHPLLESVEENLDNIATTKLQHSLEAISTTPTPSMSTPESLPRTRKRRKKTNTRWVTRGREWRVAASSSSKVVHSPSLTVALQPELDNVEGLLFVSFTSKEALDVHIRNKPSEITAPVSPVSPTTQEPLKQTEELTPATDEEKIVHKEAVLLQDLRVFKHRQVIHPVLQEVGLKLSSLNPTKSVDLQYVGVHLPLPPADLPEQENSTALSLCEKGLPFISRTGKTSDVTKIKGWKNKFIKNKESSLNSDGLQKNLSAFCSDMLDEYLESEAKQISERAAAFSMYPEDSVAYQVPAKGSSYVKTLDSMLKHRKPAPNKPCPLSHKPRLHSAVTSPAPPLPSPATPVQAKSPSTPTDAANAASGSSAVSHRSSTHHPANFGQNKGVIHRPASLPKFEVKLLQMEVGALNKGLRRTQLTPDRLKVALSVLLTKQTHLWGRKEPLDPQSEDTGLECTQEFCRLGCVCSSLQNVNRGPLHCRRPECMFGCACLKRKITKHISPGDREPEIQPVYSMTNTQHVVQPCPGSHTHKLWKCNISDEDAEPLFIPESPQYFVRAKNVKHNSATRITQQIGEEDKEPAYKYWDGMTCARVREFKSRKQKTTTDNPQRNHASSVKKTARKMGKETTENEPRKQIQIESACQWKRDHKMVLGALSRRMNEKRLSQSFCIGPYLISPLTKISMPTDSGSIVTYRVHISEPSKASDNEEDEREDSDEEKPVDGETNTEEILELEMQVGVTPFLGGVLPAGNLKARTKPAGSQPCALVQVNGKSYNQARLLLGGMGSLHPANRLAAYVTGRLNAPADISHKNSQKPSTLHGKATATEVPQTVTARRTSDLKIAVESLVPLHLDSWKKGSTTFPQNSQNSSNVIAVKQFISNHLSSVSHVQNSSKSSPVSLTVSPSLKSPSFLGQSGTYSFRICPPANESTRGQNPPGVALPGGFTLIDLPRSGSNEATQPSQTVKTINMTAAKTITPPQQDALFNYRPLPSWDANWLGLDTFSSSTSLEPCSSSDLVCGEKTSPGYDPNSGRVESNMDFTSECLGSEDSDYCGDGDDEDEELLDIETVEEVRQQLAIEQMKEAAMKTLQDSRLFQSSLVPKTEPSTQEERDKKKQKIHTVLERQRRTEQRILFDKLQTILCGDLVGIKPPRLHLLSMAVKEIKHIAETSKFLKEKKRKLAKLQSTYLNKLSILSGKSANLIKNKLSDICNRHKMREKAKKWSPFFSELLKSRAAFLQDAASQSQHMPLLHPDFITTQSEARPHNTAAQTNAQPLLKPNSTKSSGNLPKPVSTPLPHPQAASTPAKADLTARLSQGETQKEPGAPAQASVPVSQSQVPAGKDIPPTTATPVTKTLNPRKPYKRRSIQLPLIRSKTSRLILPSSMKPTTPGFFTLMLMEAKLKTGVNGDSTLADMPSDVLSDVESNHQEKSLSSSRSASPSESSHVLEETTTSLNSDPKPPQKLNPMFEFTLLNKSIIMPSVAVQDKQKGGTVEGLSKTLPAAPFSLNSMQEFYDSKSKSKPKPRRGRPPKNRVATQPFPVVDETRKPVSESATSPLVEERQSETEYLGLTKKRAADRPAVASDAADSPVPVKRGRGRPPKPREPVEMWIPAGQRRGVSKSNEDSPVRLSYLFNGHDSLTASLGGQNTSRPLTRGALGKDLPSAKRRSWIDVEKELELELESE
ncbi:MAX gene-associated protein [Pleuronectes platessa]|uniref:MAX gene-associated protein n=1 Tax=Pleuronectes platessa TaxID=8262 RepID=UPI00232A0C04|nr:MAX gene-associated protein [Pleuronectes platessa]XP_053301536.1 MAX gene-associated protein [Pleuronectes platessa]